MTSNKDVVIYSKNKEMKNVTNKNVIFVILMNIGILAFAIYSWLLYNHRQTIIKSEEAIQNYSVLEVHRAEEIHYPYS